MLALRQFQASSFAEVEAGRGTKLSVSVALEAESHEVTVGQVESWLATIGKSPKEQALKTKLADILAG